MFPQAWLPSAGPAGRDWCSTLLQSWIRKRGDKALQASPSCTSTDAAAPSPFNHLTVTVSQAGKQRS